MEKFDGLIKEWELEDVLDDRLEYDGEEFLLSGVVDSLEEGEELVRYLREKVG